MQCVCHVINLSEDCMYGHHSSRLNKLYASVEESSCPLRLRAVCRHPECVYRRGLRARCNAHG